ncbi:MAG: nitrous oxide reductase accessory protein NosL [Campylobacterota bacterium]|nr:nitrous oxide reductase accessory protein NosL [Campylobacterota bacterium]
MTKKIIASGLLATLILAGCGSDKAATQKASKGNMDGKKHMLDYRAVPASQATILQKGEQKMYCPVCGMTLPMFYKTNHAASDHTGHDKQYCSIHCAAEDKEVNGNMLSNFRTVDNTTLKFIDSQDAYFVVGSKKPGTMSTVSKYAFGTKKAAQEFASKFGGKIMMFDELYKKVKGSLKNDIAKVNKKQTKAAKMGGMIYKRMCKKIDKKFDSVAEAKAYITKNKVCGNLKGKKLQMVGLHLGKK